MIYGWVLQFGYALIPYFAGRHLLGEDTLRLGGNWFSLVAVNLGSVLVWASIFILPWQNMLHGTAYALYVISMVPVALHLGHMVQGKFVEIERDTLVHTGN